MLRRRRGEVGQWRLCGEAGQVLQRRGAARRGSGVAGEDGGCRSRGRQLPPSLLSVHAPVLASVCARAGALLSARVRVLASVRTLQLASASRALQLASARVLPRPNRVGRPPLPAALAFAHALQLASTLVLPR